jgi:hypothetical protein
VRGRERHRRRGFVRHRILRRVFGHCFVRKRNLERRLDQRLHERGIILRQYILGQYVLGQRSLQQRLDERLLEWDIR